MFGLYRKKTTDFGKLIKEKKKVVVLLDNDFLPSWVFLSYIESWHAKFEKIILKTTPYLQSFWQQVLNLNNLDVKSELTNEDRNMSIVLDLQKSKKEVKKVTNSLILSDDERFCNFSFSTWETPLLSFQKLFSLNIAKNSLSKNLPKFTKSNGFILLDTVYSKKVKKLKENHKIMTTLGDPELQKKDFGEIYNLAVNADKIFCFSDEQNKIWQTLGLKPNLVKKEEDYAKLF